MNFTGTAGNDTIIGTATSDVINGGAGNDDLYGGDGNDTITGDSGFDRMFGGAGNDFLVTKRGTGSDFFDGGDGTDRISVDFAKSGRAIAFDLTDSSTLQYFGDGSSMINIEQISTVGSSFADTMIGGALADSLNGYLGDDVLRGAGGNDTIAGDAGYDTAVFSGSRSQYTITLQSNGSYRVAGGTDGTDTLTGIENLRFSDGDMPIGGYTSSAVYWGNTDGSATLVSAYTLPDGVGMTPGTGFTITGLARAPDGTWWAANEGQSEPDDFTYTSSIIHLSADFSTKLGEIAFSGATRAIQGMTINPSTGELFVASLSEGMIRVFNSAGVYQRSILPQEGTSVNGLAYDPTNDAIIIAHENGNALVRQIEWRSLSTNTQLKTINISREPDHLFFDPNFGTQGALYYTSGDSGAGRTGYVIKVDVATGQEIGTHALTEADAIEGVWIEGDTMWFANDAYFHRGDPALNRVLKYDFTPESTVVDDRALTQDITVDLNVYDQTLPDGNRLVGIERMFFHGGTGADSATGGMFNDVLVGGNGNDTLVGGAGEDRLVGAANDDLLTGGAGNDTIEGGDGTDTVVFSGTRAVYSVTQLSATGVRIVDLRSGNPDGTDVVRDVESFRFSDGTYTFAQVLNTPVLQINLTNDSVAERVAVGTVIGQFGVSGGGGSGTWSYQIVGDPQGLAINGNKLVVGQGGVDYEAGADVTVTVRASELGGAVVTREMVVHLIDQNDPVTGLTLLVDAPIAENDATGGRVVTFIVADQDVNEVFLDNVVTVDDPRFTISGTGIYLNSDATFDFESQSEVVLNVTVTSSNGNTLTRQVIIPVTDLNEAAQLAYTAVASAIPENAEVGAGILVGQIALTDDALGTNVVSLSGDDAASFTLTATAGGYQLFYTGAAPDFESKAQYQVKIELDDATLGLAGHSEATVTVDVTDLNEPAQLAVQPLVATLLENAVIGTGVVVGQIAVSDDALGTNAVSLSGADAASFALRATAGGYDLVYVGASPDFESKAEYQVTVSLDDASLGAAGHSEAVFTLGVIDVNEAPQLTLTPVLTSLAENAEIGTGIVVGQIAVSDDALGTNAVSLSGADAASFALQATAGGYDLVYIGASPDFESKAEYQVTVSLDDASLGAAGHSEAVFTLGVTDVNEAPQLTLTPVLTSLAENAEIGTGVVVGQIAVSDDALGTNAVSLSGADAASFALQATAGGYDLVYVGASPDFESKAEYQVTVSLDDASLGAAGHSEAVFTLGITDVNEAPQLTLTPVLTSLAENAEIGTGIVVGQIAVSDDALGTNAVSLSGADAASFALQATAGGYDLVYVGASPDFETKAEYQVTVSLDDASLGAAGHSEAVFTLGVIDVNEGGILSLSPVLTEIAENTAIGTGVVVGTVAISQPPVGDREISLSGADAGQFSLVARPGGYDLVFVGASPDYEAKAQYDVTVVLDDTGAGHEEATLTLGITDVNEAPQLTLTPVLTSLAENAEIGTGIVVGQIAVSDDALGTNAVSLSGADAASFALQATAGGYDLVYIGASPDFETKANYQVTVSVDDASLGAAGHSEVVFDLAVSDENEAAAFTLSPLISALAENTAIGAGILVGRISVSDDALGSNVISLSGADASSFAVVASAGGYDLRYVGSAPDFEAKAQYQVKVSLDDAALGALGHSEALFTLGVNDVNEAAQLAFSPVLTSLAENTVVGAGILVGRVTVSDDALGTNLVSLAGADAASFALTATASGFDLRYVGASPDFETKAQYQVMVMLDDAALGAAGHSETLYTLAITDVVEVVGPTEGDDRGATAIYGTAVADNLFGLGGNDELYGLAGNDTLNGGNGDDTLFGGAGADALIGGAGIDTASYATALGAIRVDMISTSKNTGDALGDTYDSIENLIGTNFADSLIGNNAGNEIFGGGGADAIAGQGGSDRIYGGQGDDTLFGQGGNDILYGDAGNDTLSGGLGSFDYFAFNTSSFGRDTISDWEDNVDKIDFRGSGIAYGHLAFVQVGSSVEIRVPDASSSIVVLNATVGNFTSTDFLF